MEYSLIITTKRKFLVTIKDVEGFNDAVSKVNKWMISQEGNVTSEELFSDDMEIRPAQRSIERDLQRLEPKED